MNMDSVQFRDNADHNYTEHLQHANLPASKLAELLTTYPTVESLLDTNKWHKDEDSYTITESLIRGVCSAVEILMTDFVELNTGVSVEDLAASVYLNETYRREMISYFVSGTVHLEYANGHAYVYSVNFSLLASHYKLDGHLNSWIRRVQDEIKRREVRKGAG